MDCLLTRFNTNMTTIKRIITWMYVFCIGILVVQAQVIPTNRTVDWSSAGCPIPSANWPIYTNAMTAGAVGNGVHDDSAVLAGIIASCPPGQVIYLPPGNYVVSTNFVIQHPVVIRGAGPTNTIITPTTNALNPIFWFLPASTRSDGSRQFAQLSGGYTKGSTNLTLASPASLAVGTDLLIDQLNDGTFVNATGSDGFCSFCSISNGTRTLNQSVRLASIDTTGTNITIDTPLYWTYGTNNTNVLPPFGTYTTNLAPEISWFVGQNLTNCGLENLGINDYYATNVTGSYGGIVVFMWCDYSWVKNVETQYGNLAHEVLFNCYHCTVRDSAMVHSKFYASENYGVEIVNSSSACLVEDNTMTNMGAAILLGWGVSGNVIGYNYIPNALWGSPYWQCESIAVHGAHAMMNLCEGNVTPSIALDAIHGSSSHMTLFRNQSFGWQTNLCENCIAVDVSALSTYANIVGNVLGTATNIMLSQSPAPTPFFLLATNAQDSMFSGIYSFGYFAADWITNNYSFNPLSTAIINGNYDFYHLSTAWVSNAVLSLPPSLYLDTQPSWWTNWGATPWPPIGPDVAGLAQPLPAQLRVMQPLAPTSRGQYLRAHY